MLAKTSTSPSGPAGTQNGQVVGTADSRKCRCGRPGSSGSMKPSMRTVRPSSARTPSGKLGTTRLPRTRVVTDVSSRHETTPSRSRSGAKALRGS